MIKAVKISALALIATAMLISPVMAQPAEVEGEVVTTGGGNAGPEWTLISFSGAFGVALTVIGAAYGIGKLASAALESMARQPEVAGSVQTAMIIAAALIEGFTFYALFICSGMNPWG